MLQSQQNSERPGSGFALYGAQPGCKRMSAAMHVCREGHLTQLGLSGMGLSCPFPAAQLTALTYLEALDLSSNSLTGK